MRFNFYDYDETYAMHCDTEEKARVFLKHLHSIGKRWSTGRSYYDNFMWQDKDSCYRFVAGTYDRIGYYTSEMAAEDLGCTVEILEFDDFDWGDEQDIALNDDVEFGFDDLMRF